MTFTIAEAAEAGSHRGLAESANPRLGRRRVNPVCLEVPVTVQALPAEANGALGNDQPAVDCMTVIVFENGAVLRLFPALPEGQSVMICNALGRETRGRVVPMLNRDKLKGYVEIEFSEPIHDFWGVHQLGTRADAVSLEYREHAPVMSADAAVAESKIPSPIAHEETKAAKRADEPASAFPPATSAAAVSLASVHNESANESAVVDISKVAAKAAASSASKMRTNIVRALSAAAVLIVVLGAGGYVVYKDGAMLRSLLPESLQPKPAVHAVAPPMHHAPSLATHGAQAGVLKTPALGAASPATAKTVGAAATRAVPPGPRVPASAPQTISSGSGTAAAAN